MTAPTESTTTDFAVYIGESREVSRQLVEGVKDLRTDLKEFRSEVKTDLGGLKDTVSEHGAKIAVLETGQESLRATQARQAETIAPIKLHPAVLLGIILSPIVAVAAIIVSVLK